MQRPFQVIKQKSKQIEKEKDTDKHIQLKTKGNAFTRKLNTGSRSFKNPTYKHKIK